MPKATTSLQFRLDVTDDQGATASDTVTVEVATLQPGGPNSAAAFLIALLAACALARLPGAPWFRHSRRGV